jgi:acetyl esterase/lipase
MLFFAYGCELCHSLFVGGKGFVPDHETAYKTVGETDRKLHIFNPEGHEESDTRPAIVFFFGGVWKGGSPSQFYPHCKYPASRGMAAMAAALPRCW